MGWGRSWIISLQPVTGGFKGIVVFIERANQPNSSSTVAKRTPIPRLQPSCVLLWLYLRLSWSCKKDSILTEQRILHRSGLQVSWRSHRRLFHCVTQSESQADIPRHSPSPADGLGCSPKIHMWEGSTQHCGHGHATRQPWRSPTTCKTKHSRELLIFLHLLGSGLISGRYKILRLLQKHQSSSAVRLYKL